MNQLIEISTRKNYSEFEPTLSKKNKLNQVKYKKINVNPNINSPRTNYQHYLNLYSEKNWHKPAFNCNGNLLTVQESKAMAKRINQYVQNLSLKSMTHKDFCSLRKEEQGKLYNRICDQRNKYKIYASEVYLGKDPYNNLFETEAKFIKHNRIGNCDEFSKMALLYTTKHEPRGSGAIAKLSHNLDHVLYILNMSMNGGVNPVTWGPHTFLLDTHQNKIYSPKDFFGKKISFTFTCFDQPDGNIRKFGEKKVIFDPSIHQIEPYEFHLNTYYLRKFSNEENVNTVIYMYTKRLENIKNNLGILFQKIDNQMREIKTEINLDDFEIKTKTNLEQFKINLEQLTLTCEKYKLINTVMQKCHKKDPCHYRHITKYKSLRKQLEMNVFELTNNILAIDNMTIDSDKSLLNFAEEEQQLSYSQLFRI